MKKILVIILMLYSVKGYAQKKGVEITLGHNKMVVDKNDRLQTGIFNAALDYPNGYGTIDIGASKNVFSVFKGIVTSKHGLNALISTTKNEQLLPFPDGPLIFINNSLVAMLLRKKNLAIDLSGDSKILLNRKNFINTDQIYHRRFIWNSELGIYPFRDKLPIGFRFGSTLSPVYKWGEVDIKRSVYMQTVKLVYTL